jgi:hypothetical protein
MLWLLLLCTHVVGLVYFLVCWFLSFVLYVTVLLVSYSGSVFIQGEYKEHIQAIRNNNSNSGYLSHVLKTGHTYETITDAMAIILAHKKGSISEKYHIYKGYSESKDTSPVKMQGNFLFRHSSAVV